MPSPSSNPVHRIKWQPPGRGKLPIDWHYVICLFQRLLRFARKHSLVGILFSLFSSLRHRLLRVVARGGLGRGEVPPKQHRSTGRFPLLGGTTHTQIVFASRVPTRNGVSGDGLPSPTDTPYREDPQTRSLHLSTQNGESPLAGAGEHNGSPDDETGRGLLVHSHEALYAHPSGISASEGFLHDARDIRRSLQDEDTSVAPPHVPVPHSGSPPEHPDYSMSAQGLDYGLPGPPVVTDPLLHLGPPTAVSRKNERSNRSVESSNGRAPTGRSSYRQHTGHEPRTRPHSVRSSHSATHPTAVPEPPRALETEATLVGSGTQPTNHTSHAVPVERRGTLEDQHPRFAQITSADVRRYQHNSFRPPTEGDYKIDAMKYKYPLHDNDLPAGWKAYRHPEGALFYLFDRTPTFTEVNVVDEDVRKDVEYFSTFLWSELNHEIGVEVGRFPDFNLEKVRLVVEPRSDENGVLCCYYFVDHANRSLFWLDEWDAPGVFSACKGVETLSHRGLAIQAHYWGHWDLYPTGCKVTEELMQEAKDMIVHAICDHLTSNVSSAPHNAEELKGFLGLLDHVKPNRPDEQDRGHGAVVFGRIMKIFYLNYYLNFHGEPCARLNFDQSVHGWKYRPSTMMTICTPLLFFSPMTSIRNLNSIFVDRIVSKEKWNAFINRMNTYLTNTNLLATVLLNANVGFLSIHTVDDGNGTTLRQISSYLSLMASLSSILVGLILVRHNRTESQNFVFAAAKFLASLWHPKHGLEVLAILYGLPHAFLLWGMLLFFIALSAEWWNPGDLLSWVIIGMAMCFTSLLVGWCMWTARNRVEYWWFQADPNQPCADDNHEGDHGVHEMSGTD
ncbi:hypothetical protein F5141DRAFT_648567 [Pisolithus sp. B1]|nr:hypothetical protein F5141DRAFT_648567 [Pisolithus sp. B1]